MPLIRALLFAITLRRDDGVVMRTMPIRRHAFCLMPFKILHLLPLFFIRY